MTSIIRRVALVTGSAQGIGRSIALRLARDGFDVALNDVSTKRDQLQAVADDIEKIGRRTLLVPGSVSVDEDVKRIVQDTSTELEGLDVMVANAGISYSIAPLVDTKVDDWEEHMAVNGRGTFLCYKYAARQMIKQGRGGRIIGASSMAGKSGLAFLSAYSAGKFAVRGPTHSAALELGRHNITVNSYAPGPVATPTMSLFDDVAIARDSSGMLQSIKDSARKGVTKSIGQPEDIASIVSFLASEEAHHITGQSISVDGGVILS